MAAKKHSTAPTEAQPESVPAARVNDCPVEIKGPARERIEIANLALYQATIVVGEALSLLNVAELQEEEFIPHALLSRAHRLIKVANGLLSEPDDVTLIERSKEEVLHG